MGNRSAGIPISSLIRWCAPACLILASCSQANFGSRPSMRPPCEALDSLYSKAFLRPPYVLSGKARFDVNQYRLGGQFVLTAHPAVPDSQAAGSPTETTGSDETVTFDFESSSYFGSHREDVTIILSGGVTRIFDRERDTYLEGIDADRSIAEKLGIEGDLKEIIGLALGAAPDCAALEDPRMTASSGGGISVRAGLRGQPVKMDFGAPGGRLREIIWPLKITEGRAEKLRISYGWSGDGSVPETVLITLEGLRWQIKLTILNTGGGDDAGNPNAF